MIEQRIDHPGAQPARLMVSGIDDTGTPGADVALEVPGGHATMYRSCRLEEAIRAGPGKWRLTLEADRPVWIMNLLGTPTGHPLNLSGQTSMNQ